MVSARYLGDDLVSKIEKFEPLQAYRRRISNRKGHIVVGDISRLKASIYAGIAKNRTGRWSPSRRQDSIITSACEEYLQKLFRILSGTSDSKIFSYKIISGSGTKFQATVSGEGSIEGHIKLVREKAGIRKLSNVIKKTFSVEEKNISLDLGHMSGSTVAEQYATEILKRFESVGFSPIDLNAYEQLKVMINYDPKNSKIARILVEDQFFGINQSTTEEELITRLLTQAVGDYARTEAFRFLSPYADIKVNEILDIAKKYGAKVSGVRKKVGKSTSTNTKKNNLKGKKGKVFNETLTPTVEEAPKDWSRLLPIINAELFQAVAKNMDEPALVFRTGRFAKSVELTKVEVSPQGFPSLVYNYQRDPYDVFDRTKGAPPWNSVPERDPRTIIEKSIREVVADLAIGRFYMRRQV